MSRTIPPLILSSGSPRRRDLLGSLGFPFRVETKETDETIPPEVLAIDAAEYIARKKAEEWLGEDVKDWVITADTVVCLGDEALAKPADRAEAIGMIRSLSGRAHSVITGVCLLIGGRLHSFSEETKVYFRELTEDQITYYVDEYKPFDKAGAYGIQEWIGMIGISRIEGDYYNVVGLPVGRLNEELLKHAKRQEH